MSPNQRVMNLSEPQPQIRPRKKIWLGVGLLLFAVFNSEIVLSLFSLLPNTPQWNALGTSLALLLLLWLYPYRQKRSGFQRFSSIGIVVVLAARTALELFFPARLLIDLSFWVFVALAILVIGSTLKVFPLVHEMQELQDTGEEVERRTP